MDDLKTQYKKIKIADPKAPSARTLLDLGLKVWEKSRFENKRTKKNTGGTVFVNKPMNVGRRSKIK